MPMGKWTRAPGSEEIRHDKLNANRANKAHNTCTFCGMYTGSRNCAYSRDLIAAKGYMRLYTCCIACGENIRNVIYRELNGKGKIPPTVRERLRVFNFFDADDKLRCTIDVKTGYVMELSKSQTQR